MWSTLFSVGYGCCIGLAGSVNADDRAIKDADKSVAATTLNSVLGLEMETMLVDGYSM